MRIACLIPARGGSKRLPDKNLQLCGGKTLLQRSVEQVLRLGYECWVSTQDHTIAAHAASLGALVRHRPIALSDGTRPAERVIADWYDHLPQSEKPDVMAFVQCTSPLRSDKDLAACLDAVIEGADAAVTVLESPRLHFAGTLFEHHGQTYWRGNTRHDMRPLTQDCHGQAWETGACWAFSRAHWERTGNRLADMTVAIRQAPMRTIDVDDKWDLDLADWVLRRQAGAL